jgi:hypothetical protein
MNTDSRNRRGIWVAIVIVAVLYFGPQAMESFRQGTVYRQQMQAMNSRTQNAPISPPNVAAPATPVGVPAAAPVTRPAPNALIGSWQGQRLQENRKLCRLVLEIREASPGVFAGYTTLTCFAWAIPGRPTPPSNMVRALSPASAVLSGSLKDGSVAFHIDRIIGTMPEGCPLTAFTVSPFGNDQIAAQWENGECGKGQIVAQRTGR